MVVGESGFPERTNINEGIHPSVDKRHGMPSENKELLDSFVKYCEANPNQRFWQALSNWSPFSYIYGSQKQIENKGLVDLYYFGQLERVPDESKKILRASVKKRLARRTKQ
jgi:hypothetical protein